MNKIIEVKQKPVIEYSIIVSASKDVQEKIESLSLETLEVSEKSLTSVKKVRAELSKEFKVFEEQRKLVKDIILKPYNDFEEKYKEMIANKFKDADKLLKEKIDLVTDEILIKKVNEVKEYFDSINEFDFIKFEDLELKVIKSITNKKLFESCDDYIENIKVALTTINTLPNKDRVLVKFQMCKDLNTAISQTNIEIEREKQIEAQRIEQIEREKRHQEELSKQKEAVVAEAPKEQITDLQQPQVFKSSFTVYGTKEQFKVLKDFMNENNIKFEGK